MTITWIGTPHNIAEEIYKQILTKQLEATTYDWVVLINAKGLHDFIYFPKNGSVCPTCGMPRIGGKEIKHGKDPLPSEDQKKWHSVCRDYWGFGPTEYQVATIGDKLINLWSEDKIAAQKQISIQPCLTHTIASLTRPFQVGKALGGETDL